MMNTGPIQSSRWAALYLKLLAVMLVLDGAWLGTMMPVYRAGYGPLLADEIMILPGVFFYLIYVGAILVLVVLPATTSQELIYKAIILGLAAYGTYDLTNMATLRGLPVWLAIVDLCWGVIVTTLVSLIGYRFKGKNKRNQELA